MRLSPPAPLIAALLLIAPGAAAQSRHDQLLWLARQHIGSHQLDSAEAELRSALELAPYQVDSSYVYGWWGVLEYLRGSDSLARASFRRAANLNALLTLPGLNQISPGAASLFDTEMRGGRIYGIGSLEQAPKRIAGPAVVYPPDVRRRGIAGPAVVNMVIDSLGHVDPRWIRIIDVPDSGLVEPLRQMLLATTFTPGRKDGHAVASSVSLSFELMPPRAPRLSATQLSSAARTQLAAHHPDSALALVTEALDPATNATPGERVYAHFVQGLALKAKGQGGLAAVAFDSGTAGYRELLSHGVDLAPFLRRLADSVRTSRRRPAPSTTATSRLGTPSATGVDEQPALVTHPPIRYAPEMQALRVGGTLIVEATLDTTGHVVPGSLRIVQSPNPVFNDEARRVILAATYRPARQSGKAVRTTIRQPITFAPY